MASKISLTDIALGSSATDSQNFLLRTNLDGTMSLLRGATGALGSVLNIDGSGVVTFPQGITLPVDQKLNFGTLQSTASGTNIDFTGIPSWVKRITLMLNNVRSAGASTWQVQLGTSSGVVTTGYQGGYGIPGPGLNLTTGFGLYQDTAADVRHGLLTLVKFDSTSNAWMCSGTLGWSVRPYISLTAGQVTLASALTTVRLTTISGDTWNQGTANILYEG